VPLRALVDELDVRFAKLAPEFMGDPKRSPFRIYRDVRFSKDKSPYKTHAALWMYHRAPGRGVGKEVDGGAGFYVHLEPGACIVAGGLWMPPRPSLAKVRTHFSEDLAGWKKAIGSAAFKKRFETLNTGDPGAILKRIPRGCSVVALQLVHRERRLHRRRNARADIRRQGNEGFCADAADVPLAQSRARLLTGEEPLASGSGSGSAASGAAHDTFDAAVGIEVLLRDA
jgi:uncharacterized protein (TIGR02453 family)